MSKPVPGSPYDAYSFRQMQAECKKRGLKAMAKKDELHKALIDYDLTPKKTIPKPSISTSAPTSTYPPPTPPYPESEEEEEEEEETEDREIIEEKQVNKSSTPTKLTPTSTPTKNNTSPAPKSPRYPTPIKNTPYYSPSHSSSKEQPLVPGWMIQLGAGVLLFLFLALIFGSKPNSITKEATVKLIDRASILKSLKDALSPYPSGDKIIEKIKLRENGKPLSLFLVGSTDKGLEIAEKISSSFYPYNSTSPLNVGKQNESGELIMEKINKKLTNHPESVIVINTDHVDRENARFLGQLLDDTLSSSGSGSNPNKAIVILLADLQKENPDLEIERPDAIEKAIRGRWPDRVAQRIRNIIVL